MANETFTPPVEDYRYSWDYKGFGGTLTRDADGANVWLQENDASDLDDQLDAAETAWEWNIICSAYDLVMDPAEED
jgi:hypothetical protein